MGILPLQCLGTVGICEIRLTKTKRSRRHFQCNTHPTTSVFRLQFFSLGSAKIVTIFDINN